MTVRLDTLRAALWRAAALTLAEPVSRADSRRIIAAVESVERTLEITATLWETEDSRSRPDVPASETQGDAK